MTDPGLDNEFTSIAEMLWKLYSQLVRAGFERVTACELTEAALRQMLATTLATGSAKR